MNDCSGFKGKYTGSQVNNGVGINTEVHISGDCGVNMWWNAMGQELQGSGELWHNTRTNERWFVMYQDGEFTGMARRLEADGQQADLYSGDHIFYLEFAEAVR